MYGIPEAEVSRADGVLPTVPEEGERLRTLRLPNRGETSFSI